MRDTKQSGTTENHIFVSIFRGGVFLLYRNDSNFLYNNRAGPHRDESLPVSKIEWIEQEENRKWQNFIITKL